MRKIVADIMVWLFMLLGMYMLLHAYARHNHDDIEGMMLGGFAAITFMLIANIAGNVANHDTNALLLKMIYIETKKANTSKASQIKRLADNNE